MRGVVDGECDGDAGASERDGTVPSLPRAVCVCVAGVRLPLPRFDMTRRRLGDPHQR